MRKLFNTTLVALGLSAAALPGSLQAQGGGDQILGQMLTVGFNFCPRSWAAAEGQLLPINQNQSLFSLLGCTYGGDCRTTFALPDLRSRVNIGLGQGPGLTSRAWGEKVGTETVTLNATNLASHSHAGVLKGSTAAVNTGSPAGALLGGGAFYNALATADATARDGSVVIGLAGSNTAFDIRMPYQVLKTCIALQGIFPSRN
ncbi:MAG: tail fiber protein [Rhodobacter sp.]|jgi:microcystin-dependent protein|nr:tail fiber protein [Rhodobacter sp.]